MTSDEATIAANGAAVENDWQIGSDCWASYRAGYREAEAKLRAENARLREALQSIVTEYDKGPPYSEFDWIAWKQRSEKALADAEDVGEKKS